MRGIHCLQSPGILQAYSSLHSYESARRSNFSLKSASDREGSNTGGRGLGASYGVNSYVKCLNLQHSHLRKRDVTRKPHSGFRKCDLTREGKSSFLRFPCKSVDKDSSTTTTSTAEDQDRNLSTEEKISDDVGAGLDIKSGLSALDAYFNKLNGSGGPKASEAVSKSSPISTFVAPLEKPSKESGAVGTPSATTSQANDGKEVKGLKALDLYFDKLKPKKPDPVQEEVKPEPEKPAELTEEELFMKTLLEAKEEYDRYKASEKNASQNRASEIKFEATSRIDEDGNELDLADWELDQEQNSSSDLINVLVAVNIAVYLFGLASPHEAFGITDASLPFVYGAKVNDLIVAGQWWRIITPMFLHASLLHVGLGSWALLSFGPAVESAYGTLGFAMIYFLGGIFGNLMSFFHLPSEFTVGGTGPIYALVGTWVVYLLKNRETIGIEIADDLIRKVVILSALNVALLRSLPIDDWTYLGAILVGTSFGLLASPTMQLNLSLKEVDPDSKEEMGEAFLWFNDGLTPARLILVFLLFLGIFFYLYQLSITGSPDYYLLRDSDMFS